jgi:hypothetical protein
MPRFEPVETNTALAKDAEGVWDAEGRPCANLPDPQLPQDAATKAYVDATVSPGGGSHNVTNLGTDYIFGTAVTVPSTGQIHVDVAAPYTGITRCWFGNPASNTADIYWMLMELTVGAKVWVQLKSDHTGYIELSVTAAPIDMTTYIEIPVALVSTGPTAITNYAPLFVVVRT